MKRTLDHIDSSHTSACNHSIWLHRFAVLTAGATFLLILVGAVVTGKGAGLAVPDWPTTYGYNMFLYPLSKMVGGILYEHSHRLLGSLVGILTVGMVFLLWIKESRRWLRWFGVIALVLVIIQGVLGGLRVVLLEHTLAIMHGTLGQVFFAVVVSLALFTSSGWKERQQKSHNDDAARVRRLCVLTTMMIYIQSIFGAVLRHTGTGLVAHLLLAAIVAVHVVLLADRVLKGCSDQSQLVHPAYALRGLLILQLMLGMSAYIGKLVAPEPASAPFTVVMLTTAHVVTGALMLATSLVLTLRVYRLLPPKPVGDFATALPVSGQQELNA